jgi:hypothetical protein
VTDERQDFVPIEPTPVVAAPVPPVAPVPPPAQPAGAVPPPPPGYYNPVPPPPPPAYNPGPQGMPYGGYAPGGGYYPGGQYATYAPPAAPSGLSITSMVLGIVAVLGSFLYGIGLFPAIAAVITGHIARKRQPGAKGMWLTGLITGYVGIAFSILWIVFVILIFAVFIPQAGGLSDSGDF